MTAYKIQAPRGDHDTISCRMPVSACAPVPWAIWDTAWGISVMVGLF